MTAKTKLTVLDRLHTLLVVGLGALAVLLVGLTLPPTGNIPGQLAWAAIAMIAGYGTAYLTDTGFTHLVSTRRKQLLDAIRKSGPTA